MTAINATVPSKQASRLDGIAHDSEADIACAGAPLPLLPLRARICGTAAKAIKARDGVTYMDSCSSSV